jgi:hypothetical protein
VYICKVSYHELIPHYFHFFFSAMHHLSQTQRILVPRKWWGFQALNVKSDSYTCVQTKYNETYKSGARKGWKWRCQLPPVMVHNPKSRERERGELLQLYIALGLEWAIRQGDAKKPLVISLIIHGCLLTCNYEVPSQKDHYKFQT